MKIRWDFWTVALILTVIALWILRQSNATQDEQCRAKGGVPFRVREGFVCLAPNAIVE